MEEGVKVATRTIRVCIVLPAFNEGKVIAEVLKALPTQRKAGHTNFVFERVVVDDGSSDNTYQQASQVKGVTVLRHLINMGAGGATRTGLAAAKQMGCDMAITMDADGQHSVEDAVGMAAKMTDETDVDLLIGSRLQSSGNMSLLKKVGNIGLNYITFLLLGIYVSDSQSGLRAYSARALDKLQFHSNNYAFCSEMIWQAKRAGLKIAEHPIEAIYTEYSKQKGQKNFSGGLKILQQLVSRRLMDLIHE